MSDDALLLTINFFYSLKRVRTKTNPYIHFQLKLYIQILLTLLTSYINFGYKTKVLKELKIIVYKVWCQIPSVTPLQNIRGKNVQTTRTGELVVGLVWQGYVRRCRNEYTRGDNFPGEVGELYLLDNGRNFTQNLEGRWTLGSW